MEVFKVINQKISIGDTKSAIKLLKSACNDINDDFYSDQVILIESQYSQTLKSEIAGIITKNEVRRQLQKIHQSIINVGSLISDSSNRNRILTKIERKKSVSDISEIKRLDKDSVKIAMAGQPNVGKTTLMRNIFKSEIGNVGDSSNVTTKSYFEENEELGITFIDCPGFNEPGRVIDLLEFSDSLGDFKEKMLDRNLDEDYSALEGIKACDIVYYVVSVSNVPDKGDDSLIRLVKKTNPNIIGIINMEYHVGRNEPKKSKARSRLWSDFFMNNNISTIIHYDFAWDTPTKIHDLYRESIRLIAAEKKALLKKSLESMLESYQNESEKIAESIFDMIEDCRSIHYQIVVQSAEEHKNLDTKSEKIQKKIQNDITYSLQNVIHKIKSLYNVVSIVQHSEKAVEKSENILQSSSSKRGDQVREAVGIGTGIGGFFALKGLAAGAITLAGGPAVILTTAIIGGIVGLFTKKREDTKVINFQLNEEQLQQILENTVMVLWISSNKGFGIGENLDIDELKQSVEANCNSLMRKNDLMLIPEDDMIFKKRLKDLVLDITLARG